MNGWITTSEMPEMLRDFIYGHVSHSEKSEIINLLGQDDVMYAEFSEIFKESLERHLEIIPDDLGVFLPPQHIRLTNPITDDVVDLYRPSEDTFFWTCNDIPMSEKPFMRGLHAEKIPISLVSEKKDFTQILDILDRKVLPNLPYNQRLPEEVLNLAKALKCTSIIIELLRLSSGKTDFSDKEIDFLMKLYECRQKLQDIVTEAMDSELIEELIYVDEVLTRHENLLYAIPIPIYEIIDPSWDIGRDRMWPCGPRDLILSFRE